MSHLFGHNTTGPARKRVRGSGPDRKELPAYQYLTTLPESTVLELKELFVDLEKKNDLRESDSYQISEHCPLMSTLPEGFQHILLTSCAPGKDVKSEESYTEWLPQLKTTSFLPWFNEQFPGAFRVRLSLLKPGTEFSWHIDTNTSVACRCSVALNPSGAKFEIKYKQSIQSVTFAGNGDVFFTNTGWPHRVYNSGEKDRLNLVFGIKYENLKHLMEKSN